VVQYIGKKEKEKLEYNEKGGNLGHKERNMKEQYKHC